MSALLAEPMGGAGAEMTSPLVDRTTARLGVNVTAVAFHESDETIAAVTLGDGTVGLVNISNAPSVLPGLGATDTTTSLTLSTYEIHRVAAVSVAATSDGFVTAGQDGRVCTLTPGGPEAGWRTRQIYEADGQWIEALETHAKRQLIAVAHGDTIAIIDRKGDVLCRTSLGKTISGLAFDSSGKRLAVSHYNGATIMASDGASGFTDLYWKGAHVAVTWSPDDRYIVTSTQDREVHAWDLVTTQDFRMGGYPRKVRSFSWVTGQNLLGCSGADVVTAWSFAGAGPGRKPPLEVGFVFGGTVTSVAAHPVRPYLAFGYSHGNVQIGATSKGEAIVAQARTGAPITDLAWSKTGKRLIAVDSAGGLAAFEIPQDLGVR